MENKKYKLTEETMKWNGHTLHRIEAIRSFADVKIGDLGGWIEQESNLSHNNDAWIYDDAKVYGNAIISGNAKVTNNAIVYSNAIVCNNAMVCDDAEVCNNAIVCDNAKIYDYALICNNAKICNNVRIFNGATVSEFARVFDDVIVYNQAKVHGNATICGDIEIGSTHDYIVFKNHFSSGRYFTWTRSNNMWSVGCFYGTGEELIQKAYEDSDEKGKFYEAYVNFVEQLKKLNSYGK